MLKNQQLPSPSTPEDPKMWFDQEVSMYDLPTHNSNHTSLYRDKMPGQSPSPQGLLPTFPEAFGYHDNSPGLVSQYDTTDCNSWAQKHPENWTSREVCDILYSIARTSSQNISELCYKAFHGVSADKLWTMSLEEFKRRDPLFGATLYRGIQEAPLSLDDVTFHAPDLDYSVADIFSQFIQSGDQEVTPSDNKVYERLSSPQDASTDLNVRMGNDLYDINTELHDFGILPQQQRGLWEHHENDYQPEERQTRQHLLSDSAYSSNSDFDMDISDTEEQLNLPSYLADYRQADVDQTPATNADSGARLTPLTPHTRTNSFSCIHPVTAHSTSESLSHVSSSISYPRSNSFSSAYSSKPHIKLHDVPSTSSPNQIKSDLCTCPSSRSPRPRSDSFSSMSSSPPHSPQLLSIASSSESDDTTTKPIIEPDTTTRRSNRGRRPGKGGHLWEFIRDMLKDPRFNPSLIRWEDKKLGVFRIMKSDRVAQMWGDHKENSTMTYEKLSRAMRFLRTRGYFAEVSKTRGYPKKLCFQFGARSTGWM